MRFLLCGINAKYIHSNLAIFSLKAYADRKKIPGAEIILKEYTINNYVEDILQDLLKVLRRPIFRMLIIKLFTI